MSSSDTESKKHTDLLKLEIRDARFQSICYLNKLQIKNMSKVIIKKSTSCKVLFLKLFIR